jgi:flagellar M-ring protein FliF
VATLDPSAVLAQITNSYLKLPLVQRILFPVLIFVSVVGIVYASRWAGQADYVVLFSDLSSEDSAAVIAKLKDKKIKYQIKSDGSTIAVTPPEIVHETRIELSGEGVPRGGVVGLEIFETASLGTTTFQEKIKFQRAIQGELERTIGSIRGVSGARVHVAQPEKSVFSKLGSQTTASVMLKVDPSAELSKKQIMGITNLVAGSIEGLKSENVTVVDAVGNLLTAKENDGENSLEGEATRLSYQREVERGYVQRVEQMLQKILGTGKVIARVTVDMDFSQVVKEEESFDPSGQVMRSQRTIEEGMAAGAGRGGVPGVVSNLANDPSLLSAPNSAQSSGSRKEDVKNFEVSRAVSKTSLPRGKISKLSVAVLVDGTYETVAATADSTAAAAKTFKPLDDETLTRIESVVKSAVGFDAARGDLVTVENIQFNEADASLADSLGGKAEVDWIFNAIYRAGPVLFILLFFVIIVRPLVRFLVTPTDAEVDLNRLLPTGIKELEQELAAERSKVSLPDAEPLVNMEQLEELISSNSRQVKENPAQAALLIRYWLNDGRL